MTIQSGRWCVLVPTGLCATVPWPKHLLARLCALCSYCGAMGSNFVGSESVVL